MHFLDGCHKNGSRCTPRKVERSSRAKICDVQCIQMPPADLPKALDPCTQRRFVVDVQHRLARVVIHMETTHPICQNDSFITMPQRKSTQAAYEPRELSTIFGCISTDGSVWSLRA